MLLFRLIRLCVGPFALLAAGAGIGFSAAWAQPTAMSEYAIKSAMLLRLPQFIYRPVSDKSAPVAICLLGRNFFGQALERLAGQSIEGRAVRIVRLNSASDAGACEFLFVSRSEEQQLSSILRRLEAWPVVTLSDIEGFARAGGMVELAGGDEGTPVSILLNRRVAQQQKIEFNAQLLRLARVIEP